MARRRLAVIVLAVVVISAAGGWFAGRLIRSPAEVAARTAAPAASPILVPAEQRRLSTDIVTRGTARFGSPQWVSVSVSALKANPAIVTSVPRLGTDLAEGDVAVTASGRPVFVLQGVQPSYRDLGPGLQGNDVRQLEEALVRLGYGPGQVDGVYDEATGGAVAAWYTAAGFAPTEATPDQLAAIKVLEAELLSARLDILGATDAVSAAQAALIAARVVHANAVAIRDDAPAASAAARTEARADNRAAAADVRAKQAIKELLVTGTPANPSDITAAQTDLSVAQAAAEETRLTGAQTVAAAVAELNAAPAAVAGARANAAKDNTAAAAEVLTAQAALDLLVGDPSVTPTDVAAAQARLTAAQAAVYAAQLNGEQAIAAAITMRDNALAAVAAAETAAGAANLASAGDVASKQRALGALKAGATGTSAEIVVAKADLAAAQAAAEKARLAGQRAVRTAGTDRGAATREVSAAAAAADNARSVLSNAQAARQVRGEPGGQLTLELGGAQRRAGVQVPADEVIFVAATPARVSRTAVTKGSTLGGPLMKVTGSRVAVDASLPIAEAALVTTGMVVAIDEPSLGLTGTGTVTLVGASAGTNGVDASHVYVKVMVDDSPATLVGTSVRLTIPIESTGGTVVAVPVSALTLATDGSSRIQVDHQGALEFIAVKPGLSASGYVEVIAKDGTLAVGDLVVIGFKQAGPRGG